MTPPLGENVWLFHAGALGDHIMIWPLVRALARQGTSVTLVAAGSHARLCAEVIERQTGRPVTGVNAEQARFTRLWRGEGDPPAEQVHGASAVISFTADPQSDAGRRWIQGAQGMFPGANIECVGPPGSDSRHALWTRCKAAPLCGPDAALHNAGPIILFAGAGGDSKRWPLERWVILADRIRTQWPAAAIELLAGPVELERWPDAERCRFESASGRIVGPDGDLSSLARLLGMARLYIGGDTGPTHLAAQLGIPTIALFGPTDPAVWAPVGPRVCVLAPSALSEMAWLSVDVVFASARSVSQA